MSDVVEACHHGKISPKEVRRRLRGANRVGGYITWETCGKLKKFVLSILTDKDKGSVKDVYVPNIKGKRKYSSLSEASDVMERLILSSDNCVSPIPPLSPDENGNTDTDSSMDDDVRNDLACPGCDLVCESKDKLKVHQHVHTVTECNVCNKFILHNNFSNHVKKCQGVPAKSHSCDKCDFKTIWPQSLRVHKQIHERGGFQCGTCRTVFDNEVDLVRHKETHEGGEFQCPECPRTFKHLFTKDRHYRSHHRMIQSEVGFLMLDTDQVINTGGGEQRRAGFECPEPGCNRHYRERSLLERHIRNQHQDKPSTPKKLYKCDGLRCDFISQRPRDFRRHLQSCDKHKAKHPRVVPILTKDALVKILKKSDVSDNKYLAILKDIQDETGAILMEGNLKQEIQDSIKSFEEFYEVMEVEMDDKNGNKMVTSLSWVKKLPELIKEIIEKNNIKNPRVAIGGDSGKGKFIFTLSVFDMDDIARDFYGYSRAGRRRTLVIAAADDCDENHNNLNTIVNKLKLNELEELDWILTGDQKFANLMFGLQCHTCLHSCVYCEGCKCDQNGNKTRDRDNGEWVPGEDRTMAINEGRRTLWDNVCGHLKGKRSHLSTFKNVEFRHARLPSSWKHVKVLFLLPPDPLHVILLGPVQDVFTALKLLYPDIMVEFYLRAKIGRRRTQIGGNFTGVELKMLLKETALADLADIVPHGVQISQYLRSLRELHKMSVKKQYTENHMDYINTFADRFKVVRDLKLVSFTVKCHIILHHFGPFMSQTKMSLYTADTSPQESTHSGFYNCQRAHGLLTSHDLGSPTHQSRLKRSMLRYNWNNLPFDLRHRQPVSEPEEPVHEEQVAEEEDLHRYIHEEEEENAGTSEAVTMESVIQVKQFQVCLFSKFNIRRTQSSGPGTGSLRRRWSP